jgi:hypothetical protein
VRIGTGDRSDKDQEIRVFYSFLCTEFRFDVPFQSYGEIKERLIKVKRSLPMFLVTVQLARKSGTSFYWGRYREGRGRN